MWVKVLYWVHMKSCVYKCCTHSVSYLCVVLGKHEVLLYECCTHVLVAVAGGAFPAHKWEREPACVLVVRRPDSGPRPCVPPPAAALETLLHQQEAGVSQSGPASCMLGPRTWSNITRVGSTGMTIHHTIEHLWLTMLPHVTILTTKHNCNTWCTLWV